MKFSELGLSENTLRIVTELGFENPTEIQEKAIPHLLASEDDFVGQAQTGTGKTAAFVFPLIQRIDLSSNKIQVLILAPTRELANQVCEEFQKLGKYSSVKTLAVFGGTSYDRQIRGIKRDKPQVIVGTPGRVMDLMNKGILKFDSAEYIVLDEADEMLNMGFFEDVKNIIEKFHTDKRLWMFSATMPPQISKLIKNNFKNPHFIRTQQKNIGNDDIDQHYYVVKCDYYRDALCRLIDSETDLYGIVFCKTKIETKNLADYLLGRGYKVESLHGDMGQAERDQAMRRFKSKKASLMICTDVAARGIDVTNLTHVINYGLPQDPQSYVHRIGRTGRAGLKGTAVTIVDPRGAGWIKDIERYAGKNIALKKLPSSQDMKSAMVSKELVAMEGVISAVTTKGEDYKIDPTFEEFEEKLDDLSRDELLRVMFTWTFNRDLKQLDAVGDLNHTLEQSRSKGSFGRGNREGRGDRDGRVRRRGTSPVAKTGNVRFFLNIGKKDGLQLKSLLNDLSRQAGIKRGDIQNVDMRSIFSFLEVPERLSKKMMGLKNLEINSKKANLEISKG